MDDRTPRSRLATALLLAAIVAVALNQRPAVVALGPLLRDVRADTGLTAAMAGLLTSVPVLCFGAFAPLAPRLARRIGLEAAVGLSLGLLGAGVGLRLLHPVVLLYAGSLVAGAAIALANVLLPAYVKREFLRPGAVMGIYSASLNLGAALGAAVTVPLGTALGLRWRGALGMWLVLALVALALWLPVAGTGRSHRGVGPDVAGGGSWGLLRQPLAVQVTGYLGLQSVQFYSVAAWLPTLLADAGVPVREGGVLLGVSNVIGAGAALLAPSLAGRMRTQRPIVVVVGIAYAIGLTGLALAPGTATLLWVALFGIAQGGGFALALTLIVLRSPTPLVAARLGGVAQCVGYLVAAAGPLVLGGVHDLTGGWTWPAFLLVAVLVPMTAFGWYAGRDAVLAVATEPAQPDVPSAAPTPG
jgi:CP family cyanate transporter-like MFS transporter